jgi:flavodoxin
MKIGIIVHSHTGNTYSVAQRLQQRLMKSGHSVTIERVDAENDDMTEASQIKLRSAPDISSYDAVIFGAPVRGGSPSPAMTAYLTRVSTLKDKKVMCFLTEYFPFKWMGGNQALVKTIMLCESKAAHISGTGIINWSGRHRGDRIDAMVEEINSLLQ